MEDSGQTMLSRVPSWKDSDKGTDSVSSCDSVDMTDGCRWTGGVLLGSIELIKYISD